MGRFDELAMDIEALKRGDHTGFKVMRFSSAPVPDFTPTEIRDIRKAAHLPQWLFAGCMGVSLKTVEAWEGGRSRPVGTARRMLALVREDPEFFHKTGMVVVTTADWCSPKAKSPVVRRIHCALPQQPD